MPVSGTVRLKKPSESIDTAFANLIAFYCQQFERERPALVIKEKMLPLQALRDNRQCRGHGACARGYHAIVDGLA